MQLATKIRIGMVLVGALVFVGGFKAALHPKWKLVAQETRVVSDPNEQAQMIPEFVTSQGSRVFGIISMLAGGGVVLYVLLPLWKSGRFQSVASP